MKVLYGVQGTGNGHVTRARHMSDALARRKDVSVDYFFSGRDANKYFDMKAFGHYRSARGLTFITDNGRIKYSKTVTQNNIFTLINDIQKFVVKDYDLVINDFEPITAWAAKKAGVPSLSVSHQAAFLHHVPKRNQNLVDKFATRYFAPTQYNLGTHWYHFGFDIIPPFVAPELLKHSSVNHNPNDILVYLPFESPTEIREQLHCLSEYHFTCFHPSVSIAQHDKNIRWHPLSTSAFKKSLARCTGVISNCGFELSTECLSLGKPLLVKPLARQYEQLSNAYTLKQLGVCDVINKVVADDIDEWLQLRKSIKIEYPSNCDAFVDWIIAGNFENPSNICKQLWDSVVFPTQVKQSLLNF